MAHVYAIGSVKLWYVLQQRYHSDVTDQCAFVNTFMHRNKYFWHVTLSQPICVHAFFALEIHLTSWSCVGSLHMNLHKARQATLIFFESFKVTLALAEVV